jgi:hypothetical protein
MAGIFSDLPPVSTLFSKRSSLTPQPLNGIMIAMRFLKLSNQTVYLILCGLFLTCLVVADTIGAKLFTIGPIHWVLPGNIAINIPRRLL